MRKKKGQTVFMIPNGEIPVNCLQFGREYSRVEETYCKGKGDLLMQQEIFEFFSFAGEKVALFLVSMIPIVELRGAVILGAGLNVPWYETFIICLIGNLLPVPFLILLGRKIIEWLKGVKLFSKLTYWYENKLLKKMDQVTKYEILGLFLFVAIPLPGTGAWSGALIAALLDMRLKKALPTICVGVLVADVIMTLASYGVFGIFRAL